MAKDHERSVHKRSLPTARLSREEVARREVGHTDVGPATARLLVAAFVVMIVAVPVVEWLGTRGLRAEGFEPSWSQLASLPDDVGDTWHADRDDAGAWRRTVLANRRVLEGLTGFERALEDQSAVGRRLRPPAQVVLTRWLGAGNERVYKGTDDWLFYRPDVESITGPPFLSSRAMERRVQAASEWDRPPQPDPRVAISGFRRQLEALGITLIVVPTPVKPSVHPEELASRYRGKAVVPQNPSFQQFVEDLRRDGTFVFDPGEALATGRRSARQYLAADTHWRPEAMEEVAELLARFVTAQVDLPPVENPDFRVQRQEVRNVGDTARMLDLPGETNLYPAESVWLRRILRADGTLWRSSRTADVLLLGDSFTNIYSLESMGWGTSAGLAEQLSLALSRPVDRLVQNDDGAFATRAMLARDASRLDGKRVVVYQFATRELTFGDWRVPPLE